MPASSSFFERLAEGVAASSLRTKSAQAAAERAAAIKRHLEILLNTRQGASASTPDYGLADFNDATTATADMVMTLLENVRSTIQRYEPRVVIESVDYRPDFHNPLTLNFSISGYIKAHDRHEKLEIDMIMNGMTRYCKVS